MSAIFTQPIILLDVDDVLADFPGHLASKFDLPKWVLDEYDVCGSIARIQDIDISDVHKVIESKGFCQDIPVIPYTKRLVDGLKLLGRIKIVTAPWVTSPFWHLERTQWLYDHFKIHSGDVTFTHDKYLVRGDAFIDDRHLHIDTWCKCNPDKFGYRIMTQYDKRFNDNPNAKNVYLINDETVSKFLSTVEKDLNK